MALNAQQPESELPFGTTDKRTGRILRPKWLRRSQLKQGHPPTRTHRSKVVSILAHKLLTHEGKDQIPTFDKGIITCKFKCYCDISYIGLTTRQLNTRLSGPGTGFTFVRGQQATMMNAQVSFLLTLGIAQLERQIYRGHNNRSKNKLYLHALISYL